MKQRYHKKIVTIVRRIDVQVKRIRAGVEKRRVKILQQLAARQKARRIADIDYLGVVGKFDQPTQQVIEEWTNFGQVSQEATSSVTPLFQPGAHEALTAACRAAPNFDDMLASRDVVKEMVRTGVVPTRDESKE